MRRIQTAALVVALTSCACAQGVWMSYQHPNPRFSAQHPNGWQVQVLPPPGDTDLEQIRLIGRAEVHFDARADQGLLRVAVQLFEMTGTLAADRLAEMLSPGAGEIRVSSIRGRVAGRFETAVDDRNCLVTVLVDDKGLPPMAAVVALYAPPELFQACGPGYEHICNSLTFPSETATDEPIAPLKFGEPQRVQTPHPVSGAEWSPDGKRIACVCSPTDEPQVWVVSLDGQEPLRVGADLAFADEPAWSPDGAAITFAGRTDGDEPVNLFTERPPDALSQQLTEAPTDPLGEPVADSRNHLPRWSRDGKRVLFNSVVRRMTRAAVVETDADGIAVEKILLSSPDASWAPDSRRIVCSVGGVVWVMDTAGGPAAPITGPIGARDPAWSPDGRRIVFTCSADGTVTGATGPRSLSLMYPDGSDLQTLAQVSGAIGAPVWSSDSNHIAFTDAVERQVFVVGADGEGLAPLAPALPGSRRPRWAPDGSAILLIAGDGEEAGELYRVPVTRGE